MMPLSFTDARDRILQNVPLAASEECPLLESFGRVIAENNMSGKQVFRRINL